MFKCLYNGLVIQLQLFQVFERTTIKDLREKSLLLTGYLELLIKQNFSQTPEEQFIAKRPCMPDRGLFINVTGFVKESLYASDFINFEAKQHILCLT